MAAVYGYCRVSTDRQEEGDSLGTQQRMIEGYALQHGWAVAEVFVEGGVCGAVPLAERPEGARLLAGLAAGDIIITPKLDRMFRSALNALNVLEELKARDVSLHMIDLGGDVIGNGVSKLVFTILSAVAEAERDRIRDRVRDAKRDQAKRGRFLGGKRPPFGWMRDAAGQLVEDLPEQRLTAWMRELRQAGHSYLSIAAAVAERHAFTLHPRQVKRILDRDPRFNPFRR